MSFGRLAWQNFKSGFGNYMSLVFSLAFTVLVFLNFQNLVYSDAYAMLGAQNKEYIDMLIQMVSFVLVCFLFFFVWYATGVFLTKRKKEIGIYIFMGLTNQKIGALYCIETFLTGAAALAIGLIAGSFVSGLFQMILSTLSGLELQIRFYVTARPFLVTAGVYTAVYLLFLLKGYVSLVKSSVSELLSAARQKDYVPSNRRLLLVKAGFGIWILEMGYRLALKKSEGGALGNFFGAMVLVIAGTYLLFGGLLPLVFGLLSANKRFLYHRQRILWVNSVVFRLKKNYRTYAMVSVLILCSVTALATGFAMKERYENIVQFENTYTFQLLSSRADLGGEAKARIEAYTEILYQGEVPILQVDNSVMQTEEDEKMYALVPYSALKMLAETASLKVPSREPREGEVIRASHLHLMSFITDRSRVSVQIDKRGYQQIEDTSEPYLGYLQESMNFYVVGDREYERLRPLGEEIYTYNYRIKDPAAFEAVRTALDGLVESNEENKTARVAVDPKNRDIDWIRVLYPLCGIMFVVFLTAGGSILFMKLYNDAYEEQERCRVMRKLGYDESGLQKAIACELGCAYGLPFAVMCVSAWFSVRALGNTMYTDLTAVYAASVLAAAVVFLLCYSVSVVVYGRQIRGESS